MSARTAPRTSSSWTTSSTASRSPCRKLPIIHGACDMRRIPLMLAATLLAGCGGVTSPRGGGHPGGDVFVGNNFFPNAHHGNPNPPVDTIAAGGNHNPGPEAPGPSHPPPSGLVPPDL